MLVEFERKVGKSIKTLAAQEAEVEVESLLNLGCWVHQPGLQPTDPEYLLMKETYIPPPDADGNEMPLGDLEERAEAGETVQFALTKDGLDSLCYRIGRFMPASYIRVCPEWLRQQNLNHWLGELGPKELVLHSFEGKLVSIMTLEHVPTMSKDLIGAASKELKFQSWSWVPMMSRFKFASREEKDVGVWVRNSPTGFGAIHVSAGFKPAGAKRSVRVPLDWQKPHRWAEHDELIEAFGEATEQALELALQLKEAFESIAGDELNVNWTEALATAQELVGAKPIPTRDIKKAMPEEGAPETWGALIGFFLNVAYSLADAGKDAIAESIEYATGRLVTELAKE